MKNKVVIIFLGAVLFAPAQAKYFNNFDGQEIFPSGVSGGFSGITATEFVQGFEGIGTVCDSFSDNFLRNTTSGDPASSSTLTLNNLPAHTTITIIFLLAIIDSWDGAVFPLDQTQAPDFFNVKVDGTSVFSETFTNLSNLGAVQTYKGPALVQEQDLGFEKGIYRNDSAYHIILSGIPHDANHLVIDFFASGSGWRKGPSSTEESWGIDNIRVVFDQLLPGDICKDACVDISDLHVLSLVWLNHSCNSVNHWCDGCDIDQDGIVNLSDFVFISQSWLQCVE